MNGDCDWGSAVIGLIGVFIGSGITWFAESRFRRTDEESRFQSAVNALRAEVEFNVRLKKAESDEKLINYATTAWLDSRPYHKRLAKPVAELLADAYIFVSRHSSALQVELIRADQGPALTTFSNSAKSKFEEALKSADWTDGRNGKKDSGQ